LWLVTSGFGGLAVSPTAAELERFLAAAGPFASAVALALAAYLVGVVSVAGTNYLLDAIARWRSRRLRGWIGGYRSDYFGLLGRVAAETARIKEGEGTVIRSLDESLVLDLDRADGSGFVRTISRSEAKQATSVLDDAMDQFERWLTDQRNPIDLDVMLESAAYQQLVAAYQRHTRLLGEDDDHEQAELDANQIARFSMASEVSRRLRVDLPLLLTRLIGVESELYSAIDRQTAEGEFRAAISLPLAALIGVVAATYEPLTLIMLALPGALFWLGLRRRRDALMTLAQALYSGRVWSPVLGRPAMVRPASTHANGDETDTNMPEQAGQ